MTILTAVEVTTVELFASMLAVIAIGGTLLYLASVSVGVDPAGIVGSIHRASLWLAALVAGVATAGSLYFSEVADYVPCRLCWFQRVFMYPLAVILLVAAIRRDRGVRWYALPLTVLGSLVSLYHYVIEWRPSLGEGACDVGPSCTDVWFRRMGFVTLAFMAFCGFVAVTILLFVRPRESEGSESTGRRDG